MEVLEGQRKTRAIVFSDIKGYSRMMGEDESRALRLLEEHNSICVPLIKANGGAILKYIGDAILSSYESALEAVRCGIAIQQALAARNAAAPEREPILVRIGIHIGDVVLKDGDVFGDGVNIAARIEPLAEPGGIAISQTVYDMVKARPEIQTVSLGPRELKNIREAVNIYKVLVGANEARASETASQAAMKPRRWPWIVGAAAAAVAVVVLLMMRSGRLEVVVTEENPPSVNLLVPGQGAVSETCDVRSNADYSPGDAPVPGTLRERLDLFNQNSIGDSAGPRRCIYGIYFSRPMTVAIKAPLRVRALESPLKNGILSGTYLSGRAADGKPLPVIIDALSVTSAPGTCAFMIDGGLATFQQIHDVTILTAAPGRGICDAAGRDLMALPSPSSPASACSAGATAAACQFKDVEVRVASIR